MPSRKQARSLAVAWTILSQMLGSVPVDLNLLQNCKRTSHPVTARQLTLVFSGANPSALEKEAVDIYRTNVVGNINLINLALPLIEKGIDKKIVVLSTGLGDPAFSADYDIFESPFYSISKAAIDMVVAKYHAEHHGNGILIMAISPGVVDSGSGAELG